MSSKQTPILFAEWLAENHYIMFNKQHGTTYWKNEDTMYSIGDLYNIFKNNK